MVIGSNPVSPSEIVKSHQKLKIQDIKMKDSKTHQVSRFMEKDSKVNLSEETHLECPEKSYVYSFFNRKLLGLPSWEA